jgi:cyclase
MLIDNGKAVITRQFSRPIYVGDPINAIKIFNEKEVDEMMVIDITQSIKRPEPDFDLVAKLASESFMPITYGGRVSTRPCSITLT